MHGYHKTVHGAGTYGQPQPTVKQMAPIQQIDPRAVAAALQMMQMGQQAPMSRQDAVTIVNPPEQQTAVVISGEVEPGQQQAQNFSRSDVGQAIIHGSQPCGYQNSEQDEVMNSLIRAKTASVLAEALGYATNHMHPGQGEYYMPYQR